jgi:hypothetical protein
MLNHLMNSELAARDAFLNEDYFDGSTSDAAKIDGLVDTFAFLVFSAALCSAAVAVVILLV